MSEHDWKYCKGNKWQFCTLCGVIRRSDDKNKPCKGSVKMRKMEKPISDQEIAIAVLQDHVAALTKERDELREANKEICICAAIKTPSGIYRGHRHGDCFLVMQRKKIERSDSDVQGFMTSRNRFVDRREGRRLQNEAGIMSADTDGYETNTLLSEDLY